MNGGRGKEAKIGFADPLEKTSQTCFLSVTTAKAIPADARFVSVRIKGDEFPVANAGGVLTWICKKACLSDAKRLQKAMRGFRPQWMRMTSAGMGYPMTIAYNCYIDLDATDSTLLFRAAKVMEWVAWPHNAVSVTYGQPISPPPAAVVAKMLVKQAMGKSPTPAPVTATEKPIEPPGVTPTESAEGGHAGRVTLPHGSGDIETDLSGHAGRVTVGHVIVDARERVERIGAYAKREIYSALAENRVPNDDFERLLTLEGTKELLGASLTTCPLFSYSRMMRCGDQNGCWTDPSMRDGREVFVNSQWYNGHRKKLERLLARWKSREGNTTEPHSAEGEICGDCRIRNAGVQETQSADPEKLFADVPVPNLARLVIIETLKRGMDGGEAWNSLMSIPWCRQNLGLRNALLRKLKIWESAGEYAQTYSVLDNLLYDKFLILKYPTGFKVSAFIEWAQGLGLPLGDICKMFEIEPPPEEVPAPVESAEGKPMAYPDVQNPEPMAVHESEADYEFDERGKTVRDYVAQHPGCAKQQAIDDLSNMGISKVLTRLDRHPEVMEIEHRLYVKDFIEDFDDAVTILQEALDSLFAANGGYTSAHELYQTVQLKLDDFFYDNDAFDSEGEVFDLAEYLFGKAGCNDRHHIFRGGTHIWREEPDYPMADHGLLIHWARLNGGILTRQIGYDNLERRGALGPGKSAIFTIAMQKVKDKFWVLSSEEFLLKEGIEIGTEFLADVKRRLDELLSIEEQEDGISFIPMGVVGDDFFASLPPLPGSRPWSIQLLQAVIADHSGKLHYKTIARSSFTGQSHAAIVPDGCECQDFSDLVYAVIKARNNKPSISFGRTQFVDFLKSTGLYPEDMSGSSIENMFDRNGHFKWLDKNNLVVS